MRFYFSKIISGNSFLNVKNNIINSLKEEGFGILTEIDLKETFRVKLNKEYLPHTILGACNPIFADKVLSIDPHISTMLPCNVTVRQLENNDVEVAIINPKEAMGAINNPNLTAIAEEVSNKLQNALDRL